MRAGEERFEILLVEFRHVIALEDDVNVVHINWSMTQFLAMKHD